MKRKFTLKDFDEEVLAEVLARNCRVGKHCPLVKYGVSCPFDSECIKIQETMWLRVLNEGAPCEEE